LDALPPTPTPPSFWLFLLVRLAFEHFGGVKWAFSVLSFRAAASESPIQQIAYEWVSRAL